MKLSRPSALLLSALLMLGSFPALALQGFTAAYDATYRGTVSASASMKLERAGNTNWMYTVRINNVAASFQQITVFDVSPAGHYRPILSRDNSSFPGVQRAISGRYYWGRHEAVWTGDIKPQHKGPVALRPGDMDALLVNLALVRDLRANRPMRYRMVDDGRVRQMNYAVVRKENITIKGRTVVATRVSRTDGNKQQIAWISDKYPMPLRLLQRTDGRDELDLRLRSLPKG